MSKYFGAAIATLEADIAYYKANRESDPECHDARVKELEEAIELLGGTTKPTPESATKGRKCKS